MGFYFTHWNHMRIMLTRNNSLQSKTNLVEIPVLLLPSWMIVGTLRRIIVSMLFTSLSLSPIISKMGAMTSINRVLCKMYENICHRHWRTQGGAKVGLCCEYGKHRVNKAIAITIACMSSSFRTTVNLLLPHSVWDIRCEHCFYGLLFSPEVAWHFSLEAENGEPEVRTHLHRTKFVKYEKW